MASKKNQKISQQELIEKQLWKAADQLRELTISVIRKSQGQRIYRLDD